ncbi:MarR family winged helix-turn-helix transcriptional regulator [Aeromicrobium sp. CF3.5]|uniref:MarR family winged helix-turn-helix transcriptional regulator n=1 Tax=Aeromicrobium sp. CF3.5 TaxID=3373078 RepID=UPI003EE539AC
MVSSCNEGTLDSAHDLARAVARLNRRLRQERRSDLTPSQMSVLGTIRQMGSATPSAVAARERVQPPTLTRMLAALVDAGLVLRVQHPDDGRQVLVSLSDRGDTVLSAERERRDEWLADQLDTLPADQRDLLDAAADLLDQIASA